MSDTSGDPANAVPLQQSEASTLSTPSGEVSKRALRHNSIYFDSVSQTHMPSWINGNVGVIGDAGHGAALLFGMGKTLAMVAAEILATTGTERRSQCRGGLTEVSRTTVSLRKSKPGIRVSGRAHHGADIAGSAQRAQCDRSNYARQCREPTSGIDEFALRKSCHERFTAVRELHPREAAPNAR